MTTLKWSLWDTFTYPLSHTQYSWDTNKIYSQAHSHIIFMRHTHTVIHTPSSWATDKPYSRDTLAHNLPEALSYTILLRYWQAIFKRDTHTIFMQHTHTSSWDTNKPYSWDAHMPASWGILIHNLFGILTSHIHEMHSHVIFMRHTLLSKHTPSSLGHPQNLSWGTLLHYLHETPNSCGTLPHHLHEDTHEIFMRDAPTPSSWGAYPHHLHKTLNSWDTKFIHTHAIFMRTPIKSSWGTVSHHFYEALIHARPTHTIFTRYLHAIFMRDTPPSLWNTCTICMRDTCTPSSWDTHTTSSWDSYPIFMSHSKSHPIFMRHSQSHPIFMRDTHMQSSWKIHTIFSKDTDTSSSGETPSSWHWHIIFRRNNPPPPPLDTIFMRPPPPPTFIRHSHMIFYGGHCWDFEIWSRSQREVKFITKSLKLIIFMEFEKITLCFWCWCFESGNPWHMQTLSLSRTDLNLCIHGLVDGKEEVRWLDLPYSHAAGSWWAPHKYPAPESTRPGVDPRSPGLSVWGWTWHAHALKLCACMWTLSDHTSHQDVPLKAASCSSPQSECSSHHTEKHRMEIYSPVSSTL